MKSPTASQFQMEASNLPHNLLQSPPPTSGNKRRRSSSLPESVRKRQSLRPEPAPTPGPLTPLLPEPCWGVFSPPKAPSDVASLDEEQDIDRLRGSSASQTSSQATSSTESGTTQETCSTFSRKKRKQCLDAGILYVGPKDKNFGTGILARLGVEFFYSGSAETRPPNIDIFDSEVKNPDSQSSTSDSRVILRKEDDELEMILEDFRAYLARGYDEHTLFTICINSIVLRDRFFDLDLHGEDPTTRTSVRRDKWRPKKKGPDIPIGGYTYDWDIKPDTTYAVSIAMFNVKDRMDLDRKAECHPWLAECAAVCPYLTIEYKCNKKGGKFHHAKYQITAASILWLHQRKQIRQALGRALTDLKHFSITIVDATYTIWEARFRDGFYCVCDLDSGYLITMEGLKRYIEWNNAIHSWGLGANALSFKEDIVALLERQRGQQTFPTRPGRQT